MNTVNVFISYAKNDSKTVESIMANLQKSPYFTQNKTRYKYNFWWDYYNIPGEEWKKQITNGIRECDVFVCMVTSHFIGSNFILDVELPLAASRQKDSGIVILGILLEECHYEKLEIRKFELVPKEYGRLKAYDQWKKKGDVIKLIKVALKTASISSMLNLPGPLKSARGQFTGKFRTSHDKQFLSKKEIKGRKALDRIDSGLRRIEREKSKNKIEVKISKKDKKFLYGLGLVVIIIFLFSTLIKWMS